MMRIAVAQMDASANNLPRAERLVREAAERSADFVLLPELFHVPWLPATEEAGLRGLAEGEEGPALSLLRSAAREARINVIAPIYERGAGPTGYSTAFILDRSGRVVGRYRKNHVPYELGWHEKYYYGNGDSGFPVFEHEGLRFGIQICWDNMFPEGTRSLALDGARVIFSPRATGAGSLERWRMVLRANATLNTVYVASANRVGEDRGITFGGESLIVDPFGDVVEMAGQTGSGVVVAEVDPGVVDRSRAAQPYLANRRPSLYGRLARE